MGKVFRRMQDRRGAQSARVGVHTMVSCMVAYMGEVHLYLTKVVGPELTDAQRLEAWEVLEQEYRNFEQAAVNYLKGGN